MPTVSPLNGPPSRSPASPSISSVPPFMPEAANGPAAPRMVNSSARHQASGFDADLAFDGDGACRHAHADTVETR